MLCECVYVERVCVCIFLAIKFRMNYDQTPSSHSASDTALCKLVPNNTDRDLLWPKALKGSVNKAAEEMSVTKSEVQNV